MRYYFFIKSTELRDGEMKDTLHPLPGQTFGDGTPVDTLQCVHGPKDPSENPGGSRSEYPDGTVFCSTVLIPANASGRKPFYLVSSKTTPMNFHPVTDSPKTFDYKSPSHRDDKMNAAYVSFITFGSQTDDTEEDDDDAVQESVPAPGENIRYSPALKGKARPEIAGWNPAYENQVEEESELVVVWMNRLVNENGIRTVARRPRVDDKTKPLFESLFKCGETVDTIASRGRLNTVMAAEKVDLESLAMITTGPLEWYLTQLVKEHSNQSPCTAGVRSADNTMEVRDAVGILCSEMYRNTGVMENGDDTALINDMTTALKAGWTVDDILAPEVLQSRGQMKTLLSDIATGAIPLPERKSESGENTLLDNLLKNPKYTRPQDKEGFHVDEAVWKVLMCNLHEKINTLIIGPTGSGKTELIRLLCERTGTPFTIIPMGNITEPSEQLVGKLDLDPATNGTKFDWADFALAIQRPGVILLDEINRFPRHGGNALFSVLDGTRCLPAPGAKSGDKRMIDVNPDCVFFATANIGAEYVDTNEIDEAIRTRFMALKLKYLDVPDEVKILKAKTGIKSEDAKNICTVASNIRRAYKEGKLQHSVSTRETLLCARYVKFGFDVEEALEIIFLPIFEEGITDKDPDCEQGTVRGIIAQRFNTKSKQDNE